MVVSSKASSMCWRTVLPTTPTATPRISPPSTATTKCSAACPASTLWAVATSSAAARADLAEDGQDGDGVSGGDDGAKEERVDPGQTGRQVERRADEPGGGDD